LNAAGGIQAGGSQTSARRSHSVLKPGFLSRQGHGPSKAGGSVGTSAQAASAAPGSRATATVPQPPRLKPTTRASMGAATVGCGNSSGSRRHLDWEVRTATDSDDDDKGEGEDWSSDSDHGPGGVQDVARRRCTRHDSGDEADATAQLLAALGVEASISSSDGDDSDGNAAERRGAPRVPDQNGSVPWVAPESTRRQRQGPGLVKVDPAGAGRPAVKDRAAAPGRGDGGGGGGEDSDDGFLPLYDSAMQAELAGTTLAQSFDFGLGSGGTRLGSGPSGNGAASSGGAGRAADMAAAAGRDAQGLQPVNLDMNLVRNLLRSYTAQQGSAGPAGNMAAMLGLSLVAGDVAE
jgi:hypothetical protein